MLFVRRYWYLCSVEELAAWSGRRRGTVSAALFRLRQDLQEHLEREGFTPMTREQSLDAVGDIRDAFIRRPRRRPPRTAAREFPWTGAVAACLALMIVGSTFFLSQMNMGTEPLEAAAPLPSRRTRRRSVSPAER